MGRNRNHTVEVRFSVRIEKRLNDRLIEIAKAEGIAKERLIERELGKFAMYSLIAYPPPSVSTPASERGALGPL